MKFTKFLAVLTCLLVSVGTSLGQFKDSGTDTALPTATGNAPTAYFMFDAGNGPTNIQAQYVSVGSAASAQRLTNWETNSPVSPAWIGKLMPVPPRMYGSWTDFPTFPGATNVTEQYLITQCDWYSTNGMLAAGWEYINVEENWQGALDADGRFTVSTNFPSGMAHLATEIKKRGFKPGIYTGVGANYAATCMDYPGTVYTNLDKHVQQFADWGFEFIYFDACSGWYQWTNAPAGTTTAATGDWNALYTERVNLIHSAIAKTRKPIAFYVVPPGVTTVGVDAPVTVNPTAAIRQSVFGVGKIYNDGGLTWDFIPTSDPFRLATVFASNLEQWTPLAPGSWFYPFTVSFSLTAEGNRLATAFQCMIPTAMKATSSQARTYDVPSTWYTAGLHNPLTNQIAAMIHRDPAVIPGRVAWTNTTAQAWVRPIGGRQSRTNALLLVNWDSSPVTFNITNSWFDKMPGTRLDYASIYFWTNITSSVNGVAQITVPASNSMFCLVVQPAPRTEDTVVKLHAGVLSGTGLSAITYSSYGPSPWFSRSGASQSAANSLATVTVPVPEWANQLWFSYSVASAGTSVAWTNSYGVDYYAPANRVQWTSGNVAAITNQTTICTAGTLVKVESGFRFPVVTNVVKSLQIGLEASTNAEARYIIGDLNLSFSE